MEDSMENNGISGSRQCKREHGNKENAFPTSNDQAIG